MEGYSHDLIEIFNIFYKSNTTCLSKLCYSFSKHNKLDKLFKGYKNEYLQNILLNEEEDRKRKQIFNLSLYIHDNIKSILVSKDKEELLRMANDKIANLKNSWKTSVKKYSDASNPRNLNKYIIKEFRKSHIIRNKADEEEERIFIKKRQTEINKWAKESSSLLSSFFYSPDLQYSQKKAAVYYDSIVVFFEFGGNAELFDINEEPIISEDTEDTSKFPTVILDHYGIFGLDPIQIPPDFEYDENGIKLKYGSLKIIVPIEKKDTALNTEFDPKKDVIPRGKFEMVVLATLFLLGDSQLSKSNKIRFTFNQILNKLGLTSSGTNYKKIANAIFYLSLNMYPIDIENSDFSVKRFFHLINSIEIPSYNSKGEKEWVIEIDSYLRDQIVIYKNYKELKPKKVYQLKKSATPFLYSYLLTCIDTYINNHPDEIGEIISVSAHYNDLSQVLGITGKPGTRRTKIIEASCELVERQLVLHDFSYNDLTSYFSFDLYRKNKILTPQ